MINFIFLIIGCIIGILLYIYVPKILSKVFEVVKKEYDVVISVMYFSHPNEITKKGEFIRMKPIIVRVQANDENDAIDFANEIIYDGIKIEIESVEEII